MRTQTLDDSLELVGDCLEFELTLVFFSLPNLIHFSFLVLEVEELLGNHVQLRLEGLLVSSNVCEKDTLRLDVSEELELLLELVERSHIISL